MAEHPLGRRPPSDDEHVLRYPLRELDPGDRPQRVPVVIGVLWYTDFDTPVKLNDRRWWIGRDSRNLGRVRGGHAVCIKPSGIVDSLEWWKWMDQGNEGACVGFGASRAMMLLNRRRYDAFWLYHEAQRVDEWPGENYSGTSVRAAMDVLRDIGHRRWHRHRSDTHIHEPDPGEGISANRWATSVDEIMSCLNSPFYERLGAVPILNSWGRDYPHLVHIPLETLDRLLREDGEATVLTDR